MVAEAAGEHSNGCFAGGLVAFTEVEMATGEFLTVKQIADEASVNERTVRRWIAEEDVPVFVRGKSRTLLIDRADIEHHLGLRLMRRRVAADAADRLVG